MRVNQPNARRAKPDARRHPAVPLRIKRVLMPDVDAFTDPENSAEVRELTRDLCDVYAAQLADDNFQ